MWKRGDIYLWIFRFTTVVVIVVWLYMLISYIWEWRRVWRPGG